MENKYIHLNTNCLVNAKELLTIGWNENISITCDHDKNNGFNISFEICNLEIIMKATIKNEYFVLRELIVKHIIELLRSA